MHPVLAWLPFLAAIVVAFGAGVAFARVNEGWATSGTQGRRSGIFGLHDKDVVLMTALVGLLIATLLWLLAAAIFMHVP
jgi:hypothetical protein